MKKKSIGVYETTLLDGTKSFRASITFNKRHIALGSFDSESKASKVYKQAYEILHDPEYTIDKYKETDSIPFEKFITLINFRDKKMYIPNPIYLQNKYFEYYLSPSVVLKFDNEDLFYYSSHKIMQRGSHLFVADYGSQINIPSRYGIKNYAVEGRDYQFVNGDNTDYRYDNIIILNRYNGVQQFTHKGFIKYKAVIHVKSNYVIGKYDTENEAAIAYNKAADILIKNGIKKNYSLNYIEDLTAMDYADIYTKIEISDTVKNLKPV
ncbi:MAG: hypothetical protein K6B41_02900 [Butyrivibrio sp.]|nr:hypothetical protein [Butyrivibrio sp.]